MRVLALDTSTWRLDAAIVSLVAERAHEVLAHFSEEIGKGMHSRLLPRLLFELLEEAGMTLARLDGMAVGLGPGSFTGLRTGVATITAMAYAARLPVAGSSSLASMALAAAEALAAGRTGGEVAPLPIPEPASTLFVPVLDARRGQVYAGFYSGEGEGGSGDEQPRGLRREREDAVLDPEALISLVDASRRGACIFGSGLEADPLLRGDPRSVIGLSPAPSAAHIALLCESRLRRYQPRDLFALRPTYVRRRVVG